MENIKIEKKYVFDFICTSCHSIFQYAPIYDLSHQIYCKNCIEQCEINSENLRRLLNISQKKKEEKEKEEEEKKKKEKEEVEEEVEVECCNEKCIYVNTENIWHKIGCYSFCPDCFYAIGRYAAINGI